MPMIKDEKAEMDGVLALAKSMTVAARFHIDALTHAVPQNRTSS